MPFLDRTKRVLDRRGLRLLLIPAVNYLAKRSGKGVERIFYDQGIWMHETAHGYFAYHHPVVRLDMRKFDERARANFFWGYQPKAGDVVVDVGAGVGEETLTFSRAVGDRGKVICVEAHPRTYHCLVKLIQYSRLGNVIAIHRAVAGPSCHMATIEDSHDYLKNRLNVPGGIPVQPTTIDAIHQQLGLGRVHFLKMNIEGAEGLAIQGMVGTLQRTEVVCVCCHDFLAEATGDDSLRTKSAIQQFLRENGMHVVERLEPGVPPYVGNQVWGYNPKFMSRTAR